MNRNDLLLFAAQQGATPREAERGPHRLPSP